MKKLIFLVAVLATSAAVGGGCSGGGHGGDDASPTSPPPATQPSPNPTFINAEGTYSTYVREDTNTCNHSGARGVIFTDLQVTIDQDNWSGGNTVRICFSAPSGLFWTEDSGINTLTTNFCGILDTTGNFLREGPDNNPDYYVRFSARFTGGNGTANHFQTTDPYQLKLVIAAAHCANGEGTQILYLEGNK